MTLYKRWRIIWKTKLLEGAMNKISDFRTRLDEMLKERNMRAAQLSRESGVNKATLSQYLKGVYEPKHELLCRIAETLGVTPEWLEGFDTVKHPDDTPETVCRVGVFSIDSLTGNEHTPLRFEVCDPACGECFYAEADDHLYPAVNAGDLILLEKADRLSDGQAALITFREYKGIYIYRLCSDGVELQCTNGYYPPVKVRGDELAELRIIARVIASIRKW